MPDGWFSPRRLLLPGFVALVFAGIVHASVFTVASSLPPGWLLLTCAAIGVTAVAPRFPQVSLAAYMVLASGVPRYGKDFEVILRSGALEWICVLGVLGWVLWCVQTRSTPPWRTYLFAAMTAFMVWLGIAWVVAQNAGWASEPFPGHNPVQFLHGFSLFLIASNTLGDERASWLMALTLCLALLLRGLVQGVSGLYLETDLTALAAMVLPLALMGAWCARGRGLRIAFVVAGMGMLAIIAIGQNRAAAVGLIAALATLLWHSKHKLKAMGVALGIAAVLAFAFPMGDYFNRFRVLWDPSAQHKTASLDRGTIEGRLTLWAGGRDLIQDNPWFGVGPGNFPHVIGRYRQGTDHYVAHNNYMNTAAEAGVPGLMLYLALFAGALMVLERSLRSASDERLRPLARMLQASLIGYLVTGMFISRQDMALAYLLVGWALALSVGSARRPDPLRGSRTVSSA